MTVVSNSSPLIALARIGQFELLRLLYQELLIPPAVRSEVVRFGEERIGAVELERADWIQTVAVSDRTAVELLRERLDLGESEAIILAIETKAQLLLIDEARGRRVAQTQGLNHLGPVGILVLSKRRGLVEAVTPLLNDLIAAGFRMNEELYRTALELAGEV
jgi:uncharacterized protein